MSTPLIRRLTEELGLPLLDRDGADEFLGAGGECVLFFTGDPGRYKEADDVAVVLPELLKELGGHLRAGVVARESEKELEARYGFAVWPALAFFRDGCYLGAISRMQDWDVYLRRIPEILAVQPDSPDLRLNYQAD
ncbi:hypothetical protein [Thiohalorhabdus methylotrophus]|uniref:Hydrogenase expression/formation protein n=1 Tax=Thiohalorhabdus methylotrophus TaxID=3242694 RepID=A0ABV4TZT5_9GAMM